MLLVEDIVDTGLTLKYLVDLLQARGPASVHTCALLAKPSYRASSGGARPSTSSASTRPDAFVVGYGMDAAPAPPQPSLHRRPLDPSRRGYAEPS